MAIADKVKTAFVLNLRFPWLCIMKRAASILIGVCMATPALAAQAPLVGHINPSPMLQYVDVWGWTDPNTHKVYASIGNNATGMYIIDVTDPANPVVVSTVTSVPRVDMKTYQHYLYTVDGIANGTAGIVDIADPANPVVVGSFSGGHNLFIDDQGFLYVALPGFRIFDLKPDPTNPQLVYQLPDVTDGHDITVIKNRMYEFRGSTGTFIWDVTDRSAPVLKSGIADPTMTFYHNGWPTRDEGYLFITDEYATTPRPDITVWDIHNLSLPHKVAAIYDSTSSAHNCYVVGDLLAVSYYTAGFKLFDVSDPTNPVLADSYDTSPYTGEGNFDGAWGCYAYGPGNHIYISDRPNGLFIFELTGPTPVRPLSTPALTMSGGVPNPFTTATRVFYTLAHGENVTAAVYDVRGSRVKLLESGRRKAGSHELSWNGANERGAPVASGVYYLRIQTREGSRASKLTLVR